MNILVTGTSGHLGEGLMRTLRGGPHRATGLDRKAGAFTDLVGSIADREFVRASMRGMNAVLHAATLHKPHLETHTSRDFVDTNIAGTLNLLEAAAEAGVRSFVFTSTTSTFGSAMTPGKGEAAVWVTEELVPVPKNMYGASKVAAEYLCELVHRRDGLACLVLRTSRFFPEDDDDKGVASADSGNNAKANEFLHRRADIQDIVDAHLLAIDKAPALGFGRYIITATTPFGPGDLAELRVDAPRVVARLVPEYVEVYARRGWKMFPDLDRVYVNDRARRDLGWRPKYDFREIVRMLAAGEDPSSPLARAVGHKGYHDRAVPPYTVA